MSAKCKPRNLIATGYVVFFILLAIGFSGCYNQDISQTEYLELPHYDLDQFSESDFETLSEAIARLEVASVDGYYVLKYSSGAEVNIAPELYELVEMLYTNTNNTRDSILRNREASRLRLIN